MNAKVIDMAGKKFSAITALRITGKSASGDLKWLFVCDCGIEFEANGYYARTGKIKSCPSCSKECVRLSSVTHGMSESPEFSTWTDIQTRCYNKRTKAYKDYGGRGISVCDRWLESFENFLSDMGNRPSKQHSIDRINNDGNYEPGNCRWAERSEQANNKRNNKRIVINGISKTIAEWAHEHGLLVGTVWFRVKSGLSGEDLIAPSRTGGTIVFNGVKDTLHGWSKRTGIKTSTIAMRITKYNWPIEKALTKGAWL